MERLDKELKKSRIKKVIENWLVIFLMAIVLDTVIYYILVSSAGTNFGLAELIKSVNYYIISPIFTVLLIIRLIIYIQERLPKREEGEKKKSRMDKPQLIGKRWFRLFQVLFWSILVIFYFYLIFTFPLSDFDFPGFFLFSMLFFIFGYLIYRIICRLIIYVLFGKQKR